MAKQATKAKQNGQEDETERIHQLKEQEKNGRPNVAELKAQLAQEEQNERLQRASLFMNGDGEKRGYNQLVADTGIQVRAGWRPAVTAGNALTVESFEALVDVESGQVIDVLEVRPR